MNWVWRGQTFFFCFFTCSFFKTMADYSTTRKANFSPKERRRLSEIRFKFKEARFGRSHDPNFGFRCWTSRKCFMSDPCMIFIVLSHHTPWICGWKWPRIQAHLSFVLTSRWTFIDCRHWAVQPAMAIWLENPHWGRCHNNSGKSHPENSWILDQMERATAICIQFCLLYATVLFEHHVAVWSQSSANWIAHGFSSFSYQPIFGNCGCLVLATPVERPSEALCGTMLQYELLGGVFDQLKRSNWVVGEPIDIYRIL